MYFIGIDVHKRKWAVTIRVCGMVIKKFVLDPASPKALKKYLDKHYPGGKYKAVYEAGFCGFWIKEELDKLGIECSVVHAADIPTTHKEKISKTDKLDSKKLAYRLEKGELKSIYIPSKEAQGLRSLTRLRWSLKKEETRIKNIRFTFDSTGYSFCNCFGFNRRVDRYT